MNGPVSWDFWPSGFSSNNPPYMALIHGLKPYGFAFAEKIKIIICNIRIPQSQWDRGI
jgi:hypothetical protein